MLGILEAEAGHDDCLRELHRLGAPLDCGWVKFYNEKRLGLDSGRFSFFRCRDSGI